MRSGVESLCAYVKTKDKKILHKSLPVSDGEYHLFMRIYVPDMTALDSWQPPVIREQ